MALDIYSGSLTRYYCRDWENVAEKMAKAEGLKYTQISPDGPVDKADAPSPDEVRTAIGNWRRGLSKALGDNISSPLEWDESTSSPYATDRPGYPGYGGLLLWAAYADHDDKPRPEQLPEDGWFSDPVFAAATEKESGTSFRQIIQPEMWLPCEFEFSFQAPSPVNQPTWIGSSIELKRQLQKLNDLTFNATQQEIESWLNEEIVAKTEVEHAAKFAFAVFDSLCRFSIQNRVPIVVSC
jgi:hypothetical protein